MRGNFFEEFKIGTKFTSPCRTITDADITFFGTLTGDTSPLQMDQEYARRSIFRGRIAHGLLVQSIAVGETFAKLGIFEGTSIALLGFERVRFRLPVRPGDTICAVAEVIGKRKTRERDRGIVTLKCVVMNQRDEIVVEFECTTLVKQKKP